MPLSVETPGTNREEMPSEEEGPRYPTEPSATSISEPKTSRSAPATVADVPWLADVEQMRRRVLAEAESLRGEARGHYENLSAQAREKLEEAVWEASSLAGLQSQSAETLSLLARDNIGRKFKGSAEEVARWQAQVVRSVEDRVIAEFESFVDGARLAVRGNPNLANVVTVMIGIRNSDKDTNPFGVDDDGLEKCATV